MSLSNRQSGSDPAVTTVSSGLTGGQVARRILDLTEVKHVLVAANCRSENHYDPRQHVVNLSLTVFYKSTIRSTAIAAHEAAHAVQQARNYFPFKLRVALFPLARAAAIVLPIFILISLVTHSSLLTFDLWAYGGLVLYHLLTIPIELNASSRAHTILLNGGMIEFGGAESAAIKKILRACALSYALAFLTAPLHLLAVLFRVGRAIKI